MFLRVKFRITTLKSCLKLATHPSCEIPISPIANKEEYVNDVPENRWRIRTPPASYVHALLSWADLRFGFVIGLVILR
jgi:hypothetical protein